MKKPSKSPTVLLKQKVKERILTKCAWKVGKSEGPSTTSGAVEHQETDVPPAGCDPVLRVGGDVSVDKPRIDWPSILTEEQMQAVLATMPPKIHPFTPLPVEDSTAINKQAKAVISKVKTARSASDLDRLERSQLRGKPKGPSSTRSSE